MELTLIRNWQIDKQIRKVWNVREEWIQWEHVKQNKVNRAVPSLESGKREPGLLPYKALAFLLAIPLPKRLEVCGSKGHAHLEHTHSHVCAWSPAGPFKYLDIHVGPYSHSCSGPVYVRGMPGQGDRMGIPILCKQAKEILFDEVNE